MSGYSNYAEQQILQHSFGISSWTAPSSWYIRLHTADPGEAGANNEISGEGYTPQNNTSWEWDSGNSRVRNSALIRFDDLPSAVITHFSIHSAASGGTCLSTGALAASRTVEQHSSLEFAVDTLRATLD